MQTSATDRQRLVDANIPFVRALAAKVKESLPREVEYEDLVGYGMQGLLEAADRYDERHGAVFTTFAYYRIRGAMFDGLRGMGWLPRPDHVRQRMEERACAYLQNLAERETGGASLEDESAPSPLRVHEEVRHLSETLGGVATVLLASMDAQAAEEALDPAAHQQLEQRERDQSIKKALGKLPDKERRLLELYYYEDKSLAEAGAALGLSKSWSSRLHSRAIALLQSALAELGATPDDASPKLGRARRR